MAKIMPDSAKLTALSEINTRLMRISLLNSRLASDEAYQILIPGKKSVSICIDDAHGRRMRTILADVRRADVDFVRKLSAKHRICLEEADEAVLKEDI